LIRTTTTRHKAFWLQAAALLIAGLAAWPLFSEAGLLNTRGGGDSPFLLQRLHQLTAALLDGHWPVRWMPDANYGYGYPFFNFYAPLSIYVAAFFRLAGFSYVGAIQLAQLGGFLVAAWAMFRLGQRWLGSSWGGLLASAAYTLAPFHMVNVYVRGDSLAEFWAMAFYPLLFLAVDRLVEAEDAGRPGGVAWLGLAFAALVLSHNVSALIFTPFLLLYLLLVSWRSTFASGRPFVARRHIQLPALLLCGLLLGLALSAWFWLPALREQRMVQLAPVTAGYFHYSNHFRGWDLAQSSLLFDYEVAGGRAFRMGLVQAAAALVGLMLLLYRSIRPERGGRPFTDLFVVLALGLSTVMITPLSRPLWDQLPLLPFTQFPWRFLSVQAFFAALAIGALAWLPWQRIVVPGLVTLLVVAALAGLRPDHLALSDADVTAEALARYEWFTGNIGSTVSAEYLPHTVQPRPYSSAWLSQAERDRVQVVEGRAQVVLQQRATTRQEWRVEAGPEGATLVWPTLYFEGWRATLNGESLLIRPSPGSGLILAEVPPGAHLLRLHFGRTPTRRLAELLSLAAAAGALWLVWPGVTAILQARRPSWRPFLYGAAILVPILLLVCLWPQAAYSSTPRHWDFAQMGYLSHAPAGISFENGYRLQEATFSGPSVAAGEDLLLRLRWSAGGVQATVSLATPAIYRFPQAPLLVWDTQTADDSGETLYRLPIPGDAPPGLYAPRVSLTDGSSALTPSGARRGELFLEPVRVTAPAKAAVSESFLDVRVDRVQERPQPLDQPAAGCSVSEAGGRVIDAHLAWLAARPLSHNYTVSLRLTDNGGLEVAQCDSQPGYGFLPSSAWPPGQWVDDRLALPLPAQLPEATPYGLTVRLYERETGTAVLTRRLGELVWLGEALAYRPTQPLFTLPPAVTPLTVTFAEQIRLRGYVLETSSDEVALTLYWQALSAGQEDFTHFVHLVDAGTGEIVAQHDAMPRRNSYPTSQWSAGEIVADPLELSWRHLPPGDYRLAVGLYRAIAPEYPRLTAVDDQGRTIDDNRIYLPDSAKRR
jgi:hypothetical protein